MALLVVTWLVDLIWMVYWFPYWNSDEMKDWQKGVHNVVMFFAAVNFLMKVSACSHFMVTMIDLYHDHAWFLGEGHAQGQAGRDAESKARQQDGRRLIS